MPGRRCSVVDGGSNHSTDADGGGVEALATAAAYERRASVSWPTAL